MRVGKECRGSEHGLTAEINQEARVLPDEDRKIVPEEKWECSIEHEMVSRADAKEKLGYEEGYCDNGCPGRTDGRHKTK